ncbi:6-bladed beta-propeller, partial [Bacteroides thetaiotaomicron]|nr:6-bladed beta-propeller [Bacteroides thetaiotaomicron]
MIEEDDLPGCATAKKYKSDKEMMELTEETAERADFLRSSNYVIPLIKFFNDDYVYVVFVQNRDTGGKF